MVLRRAALAGGAIGSRAPETIRAASPASPLVASALESGTMAQEDASCERVRAEQDHGCRDVGAVGVAERHRRRDTVALARCRNEVGKLVRAVTHVVLVEDALGESAEEARHALAARR